MKTVAIVQARMGSSRFPDKVMQSLAGRPMIDLVLSRLSRARHVDDIILATSNEPRNERLAKHVEELGYRAYRGSEDDVLDRYYQAACLANPQTVIRITGDCPLTDPDLVDQVIEAHQANGADYTCNIVPPTYPDGLDIEVFSFSALKTAWQDANRPYEREHVTPHIRESGRFRVENVAFSEDLSHLRWTVDEPADLEVIRAICDHFRPRTDFSWLEALELVRQQPEILEANRMLVRNEGAALGAGQKLWKRAKHVIPGGSMVLSKRSEMFLPEQWPSYFSKAKGCKVWDLDGREYTDMCVMGIGTNTLGYGHPEVDEAVMKTVTDGNMSTLNCPEEVYLAEKLVELHPWADMVRFARSGGEANAIAIRIARAASGKDKVAFCGYHGWHDWYLAANLGSGNILAGHLLPGLEPSGVPQDLRGSVLPFEYNDFHAISNLVRDNDIGVIKMEVSRNFGPAPGFLEHVRKLATDNGIVLIFDECTSGFRQTFGGLHKMYGVEPDMAMFGKALGNGYAITGTIGRREVMEAAQGTFISSTFWTERIGPTAGLKTLEIMDRMKSWEMITATGNDIKRRWQQLAGKHGVSITQWGLPALCGFSFTGDNANAYKSLITQEMLEKGYLASDCVYVCTEHTSAVVDAYFEALDPLFAIIKSCDEGRDVMSLLNGPVAHERFKRLN